MRKDSRVNEYGVDVKDIKPGKWVLVRWDDYPDEVGLVIDVEHCRVDYKGERGLQVYFPKRGCFDRCVTNSQVVKILSLDLVVPTF